MSINVTSAADLLKLMNKESPFDDWSEDYVQTANIDMAGVNGQKPIGEYVNGSFTGTYDGQGFTISNISIPWNGTDYRYYGLFGGAAATLVNIRISGIDIIATYCSGGLVGRVFAGSSVSKCSVVNCTITKYGTWKPIVGGLIGVLLGSYGQGNNILAENCFARNVVIANTCYHAGSCIGNIDSYSIVQKCYGMALSISASVKGDFIGSISPDGSVTDCVSLDLAGMGFYGEKYGTVTNCSSLTDSELQVQSNYPNFDFDDVWIMDTYARHRLNNLALTVSSDDNGSVTVPGEGEFIYDEGETVDITAVPDAEYEFSHWSGTAVSAGKVDNIFSASTTVYIDGNYTLTANFTQSSQTITISSVGGGSVTVPGEGEFTYGSGSEIEIVAAAGIGRRFVQWTGSAVDAGKVSDIYAAETTILVDDEYTLIANFESSAQQITISSTSGGSVTTPGEGKYTYYSDSEINVTAAAIEGYHFLNWTGTAVTSGKVLNPYGYSTKVTVDGDYTLIANFESDLISYEELPEPKTIEQLVSRVKQLIGRPGVESDNLELANIIIDCFNEALLVIVRKCPNLQELQCKNSTSLVLATDEYEYDLSNIYPQIAHLHSVLWIIGDGIVYKVKFLQLSAFDNKYPVVEQIAAGIPSCFTKRGNVLEFNCPVSSDHNGLSVKFNYTRWARCFTTDFIGSLQTSDITNADWGLILFAWGETLRILAKNKPELLIPANEKRAMFDEWLDRFANYQDMQTEGVVDEEETNIEYDD